MYAGFLHSTPASLCLSASIFDQWIEFPSYIFFLDPSHSDVRYSMEEKICRHFRFIAIAYSIITAMLIFRTTAILVMWYCLNIFSTETFFSPKIYFSINLFVSFNRFNWSELIALSWTENRGVIEVLVTQVPLRQFTFVSITPVKIDAWRCDWKIAVAMCDYTQGSQTSHVSSMEKLYSSSKKKKKEEERYNLINYINFGYFLFKHSKAIFCTL